MAQPSRKQSPALKALAAGLLAALSALDLAGAAASSHPLLAEIYGSLLAGAAVAWAALPSKKILRHRITCGRS